MDHGRLRLARGVRPSDLPRGNDGAHRRRRHGFALLVDDEAAVGVAIEGEAEVGALGDDARLEVNEVLRVERVRLVVREVAVEFEVHRHDFERQRGQAGGLLQHRGHRVAAHAVAGVDDELEGADARQVDERTQVARVVGQNIHSLRFVCVLGLGDARVEVRGRAVADRAESGVERDALRACGRDLDAVVGSRVV